MDGKKLKINTNSTGGEWAGAKGGDDVWTKYIICKKNHPVQVEHVGEEGVDVLQACLHHVQVGRHLRSRCLGGEAERTHRHRQWVANLVPIEAEKQNKGVMLIPITIYIIHR